MLNWCLTDTYWYLHDYSLFNWSFTKLVLIDSLNQINIYWYLTVTHQYLVCAYIVKATFNWSWPIFKNNSYIQTCDFKTVILRLVIPRPWNSLSIEFFALTYALSDFKSTINRSFNFRFFLNIFSVSCNLFCASFLVAPCLIVSVQHCM